METRIWSAYGEAIRAEKLRYLREAGVLLEDLRLPTNVHSAIINKIQTGTVDAFPTSAGYVLTALGVVQIKDLIQRLPYALSVPVRGVGSVGEILARYCEEGIRSTLSTDPTGETGTEA